VKNGVALAGGIVALLYGIFGTNFRRYRRLGQIGPTGNVPPGLARLLCLLLGVGYIAAGVSYFAFGVDLFERIMIR